MRPKIHEHLGEIQILGDRKPLWVCSGSAHLSRACSCTIMPYSAYLGPLQTHLTTGMWGCTSVCIMIMCSGMQNRIKMQAFADFPDDDGGHLRCCIFFNNQNVKQEAHGP